MYEALKISRAIVKKNKWFFLAVLFISIGVSVFKFYTETTSYKAQYIAAPYYESAADVKYKVEELAKAINENNQNYINKHLSKSLNVSDLSNAKVKKDNKPADYTFKHIKVRLLVDVVDSSNIKSWDKYLHTFYEKTANDTSKLYRGREVLKERLNTIAKNNYAYDISDANHEDHYLNLIKFFTNRDSITISDSNMIDLVFAQYIAEFRNSKQVNEIITLESSFHEEVDQINYSLHFFFLPFGPFLLIVFLWSAYEESKKNH